MPPILLLTLFLFVSLKRSIYDYGLSIKIQLNNTTPVYHQQSTSTLPDIIAHSIMNQIIIPQFTSTGKLLKCTGQTQIESHQYIKLLRMLPDITPTTISYHEARTYLEKISRRCFDNVIFYAG
jgi:hypothetical protein